MNAVSYSASTPQSLQSDCLSGKDTNFTRCSCSSTTIDMSVITKSPKSVVTLLTPGSSRPSIEMNFDTTDSTHFRKGYKVNRRKRLFSERSFDNTSVSSERGSYNPLHYDGNYELQDDPSSNEYPCRISLLESVRQQPLHSPMSCKRSSSPRGHNILVSTTGQRYVACGTQRGNKELPVIGSGSFGTIMPVRRLSDNDDQSLVWKILPYADMTLSEKNQLCVEINSLKSLRSHPHVVTYYDRAIDHNAHKLYIVMQRCHNGDLDQFIKGRKSFAWDQTHPDTPLCLRRPLTESGFVSSPKAINEDFIWKIFAQCASALEHTHAKGIIHRDIKPANILLDDNYNVQIADFGLAAEIPLNAYEEQPHASSQNSCDRSRLVSNSQLQDYHDGQANSTNDRNIVGTPFYMSPERMNHRPYGANSDVWSLGCIVFELMMLSPPFVSDSPQELRAKLDYHACVASSQSPWEMVHPGQYDPSTRYSEELHRMVNWLLRYNPAHRPSSSHVFRVQHQNNKLHTADVKMRLVDTAQSTLQQEYNQQKKRLSQQNYDMIQRENRAKLQEDSIRKREANLKDREDQVREALLCIEREKLKTSRAKTGHMDRTAHDDRSFGRGKRLHQIAHYIT